MGNATSSHLISSDKVNESLGEDEENRLRKALGRLLRQQTLSQPTFRTHIVGEHFNIPQTLSDRIFDVCDVDAKGGLDENEVLQAIATLRTYPTLQFLRFLFAVYDIYDNRSLTRDALERFIGVIYGRKRIEDSETKSLLDDLLSDELETPQEVNLEEFATFMQEHPTSLLSEWIRKVSSAVGKRPCRKMLALEKVYDPATTRDNILRNTTLKLPEIQKLQEHFRQLEPSGSKLLPVTQLKEIICPSYISEVFFHNLMSSHTRYVQAIDLEEFCGILARCCKGSWDDRIKFLFQVFARTKVGQKDELGRNDAVTLVDSIREQDFVDDHDIKMGIVVSSNVPGINQGDKKRRVNDVLQDFDRLVSIQGKNTMDWDTFSKWTVNQRSITTLVGGMIRAGVIKFGLMPRSRAEQFAVIYSSWISACNDTNPVGQQWNMIASGWWTSWCNFANFNVAQGTSFGDLPIPTLPKDTIAVGPEGFRGSPQTTSGDLPKAIANWSLLRRSGTRRLKDGLVLGKHFHLIPHSVWEILQQWYDGGPELTRVTISLEERVQLELNPLVLRIARTNAKGQICTSGVEVRISCRDSLRSLAQRAGNALLISNKERTGKVRLWHFPSAKSDKRLLLKQVPSEDRIDLSTVSTESILLIELQEADGSWPLLDGEQASPKASVSSQQSSEAEAGVNESTFSMCVRRNSSDRLIPAGGPLPMTASSGLVGLKNLGNTCYLSSALQCLSHTRLLSDYFRSGSYLHDINTSNEHGMKGQLAVVYGDLIRTLWSTSQPSVSPILFKNIISKFNSHFSGNDQHDSQELLAFVLSGLSEDLNRVVKKPYIEQPDSNGRCDSVVADEWWKNHLRREISVIVALFTGQYRSLLSCDTCGHESARFEPYTFLQLPLPESPYRSLILTIIFSGGSQPVRYSIRVRRSATLQMLAEEVVAKAKEWEASGIISDTFGVNDIAVAIINLSHRIGTIYSLSRPVSCIKESDNIVIFQLDRVAEFNRKEKPDTTSDQLKVNDAIDLLDQNGKNPTSSRIVSVNENGTFDIVLSSGNKSFFGVSRARIVAKTYYPAVVYMIHRRVEKVADYFTNPFTTRLFGTPFLLRLVPGVTTGAEMYAMVWNRVGRMLSQKKTSLDPIEFDKAKLLITDSEYAIASGADLPQWPICLRQVTADGANCSRCRWLNGCKGCLILPSKDLVRISAYETIAVDWSLSALQESYDPVAAGKLYVDPTIALNEELDKKPLHIDECLEIFTAPEKIAEGYCSYCHTFRPSTKVMDLWRLPPVLVIHLKRFQYTQYARRKLHNLVDFPINGFDIRKFVAKYRAPRQPPSERAVDLTLWEFLGGKYMQEERSPPLHVDSSSDCGSGATPILDSPGRSSFVYDLYGVVHHMGALGAGHYVATVRHSNDGRWKCFNDVQCRNINEEDVVSNTAYLLFYIRRDMKDASINDFFPRTGKPLTPEEIERILDQPESGRCTIS